jgi:hypothetical protein
MSVRFAQVVHVYPNYRMAEVVMCDNSQRYQNVMIATEHVTSNSGSWRAHGVPRPPAEEDAGGIHPEDEYMPGPVRTEFALVTFIGGRPMITGWMPPPLSQMMFTFEQQNREVHRHPAGLVETTSFEGNWELHHSGGAFLRGAYETALQMPDRHEDLTPFGANENWLLPENDPIMWTMSTGDQGEEAVKLRWRHDGCVDQMSTGYWHVRHLEDLHFDIGMQSEFHVLDFSTHTAGGDIRIRTPTADVLITAGGDFHVLALGQGNVVSAERLLLGSLEKVVIEAPIVEISAPEAVGIVTGVMGITGEVGIEGGLGVEGVVQSSEPMIAPEFVEGLGIGFGGEAESGGVEAEMALAEEEVAAAEEDLAEAEESIEEAVLEAQETHLEAVAEGGDPDNMGEGGEPAEDVP